MLGRGGSAGLVVVEALVPSGVPIENIQDVLGHSSPWSPRRSTWRSLERSRAGGRPTRLPVRRVARWGQTLGSNQRPVPMIRAGLVTCGKCGALGRTRTPNLLIRRCPRSVGRRSPSFATAGHSGRRTRTRPRTFVFVRPGGSQRPSWVQGASPPRSPADAP